MNIYLDIILIILIGEYLLSVIVESLNIKNASFDTSAEPNPALSRRGKERGSVSTLSKPRPLGRGSRRVDLPQEFQGFYDAQKYQQAQSYLRESTVFELIKNTFFTWLTIVFILIGGFNLVDSFARRFNLGDIPTALIFAGVLLFASQLLSIPFSAYHTFVLEAKYGFNRTSPKTFISDIAKSWLLIVTIGGVIFSLIIWFFSTITHYAWLYCWVVVTLFEFFLVFIAPLVILPLFNKFIPLEDGELKRAIEQYAQAQQFKLKGIFKIDASRRSTKSNAYLTGFGKYKCIALFDMLIEKHTPLELLSILSHEIGHYKKKHIIKEILFSIISSGVMFFILSFFINNQGLFAAFKMQYVSIYASLFFFGFLYQPINFIFSFIHNAISRKNEIEADAFVVSTLKCPEIFITALKKLSRDNLSNLTPHPLKVFLHYSHPPILERIRAIRAYSVKV